MLKRTEKLAILGGEPIRSKPLPLYNTLDKKEKKAVNQIFDSGVLSGFAAQTNDDFYGGKWVKSLESSLCEKFDSNHAIAVNSATSALHAAVAATGVGPGDEVIVTPYSMTATPTAILYTGALPIFADIEPDTYGLDPKSVEKNINKNTKGIIVVNLFGHPARLPELQKIAKKNNLFLIEDNAQAPGALIDGKLTGTFGDAAIYSFNRHKIIQSGEGGAVTCNDQDLAMRIRLIRNHGEALVDGFGIKDITNILGLNYRICNFEAAIADIQVSKLDILNKKRIDLANFLTEKVSELDFLSPPLVKTNCTHTYYFFPMKYDAKSTGIPREIFTKAVEAEGFILKAGYTRPLYMTPVYQQRKCFGKSGFPFNQANRKISYSKGICPVVEKIEEEQLVWTTITYPPLKNKDMQEFVNACKKVVDQRKALLSHYST